MIRVSYPFGNATGGHVLDGVQLVIHFGVVLCVRHFVYLCGLLSSQSGVRATVQRLYHDHEHEQREIAAFLKMPHHVMVQRISQVRSKAVNWCM